MKLALLDYSGTLINDGEPVYHANNIMLSRRGMQTISYDCWKTQSQGSPAGFFEVLERKLFSADEKKAVNDEFADIYRRVQTVCPPKPFIGVVEALHKLKERMPVVVISTTPLDAIKAHSAEFGFPEFDAIYAKTPEHPVVDKVDRIARALRQFNVSRFDAVYVGDTVNDMQLAREAGVATAAVSWGYHSAERLQKENPTHGVCRSFPTLVDYLLRRE